MARKTVSISEETHSELTKLGVYGETIDDIIRKCIDVHIKKKLKTRLIWTMMIVMIYKLPDPPIRNEYSRYCYFRVEQII